MCDKVRVGKVLAAHGQVRHGQLERLISAGGPPRVAEVLVLREGVQDDEGVAAGTGVTAVVHATGHDLVKKDAALV